MSEPSLTDHSNDQLLDHGSQVVKAIQAEIRKVLYGPEIQELIDLLIIGMLADGHILAQASVGLGKTLTCEAFAQTMGGVFNKFQFEPDLMPSDISGFMIFNQKTQELEVSHGPLWGANIVLADEINRGTPKAQSAFLEAMEHRRVTIRGNVFRLRRPFMVLATRNPIEHEGTYDLPEAQLDRFLAQANITETSEDTMVQVLSDQDFYLEPEDLLQKVKPVTTPEEILKIRSAIFKGVHVEPDLIRYIARLCIYIGKHELTTGGASPRGAKFLRKAAMVAAFMAGPRPGPDGLQQYFVAPEDVKRCAIPVLAHRTFFKTEARYVQKSKSPREIVQEALNVINPD